MSATAHLDGLTIVARIRAGESVRAVADSLGCSDWPIRKLYKRIVPDRAERAAIQHAKSTASRRGKSHRYPAVRWGCGQ